MKRLPPEQIEEQFVNAVYDKIAPHFDYTRYKPWPGVKKFVEGLPDYSTLIDVGCGNGRNIGINPKVYDVGTDFSLSLIKIAKSKNKSVFCADALKLPVKSDYFDNAICIAVIHHFASEERRIQCMKEICRIIKVGGTAFVTAWATKQKNKIIDEPDQMVKWHVRKEYDAEQKEYDRFYHFFQEDEFQRIVDKIPNLKLISQSWEADNWEVVVKKVSE
ncbi:hypothetical protein TVAG_123080 [Trichomonas vaginalis G3]|uniref:Methyltransferase type 11 domain-containing protein n=1 Tax=Trichomonas vaginalis (strain ATCC PRA-98 / G3) TaxID=412133 RepID=A2FH79_TRIV3|nr:tRNA (uracil) methyltransferase protein [Trichomonas vaginalis G3]EAX95717.1 hypothetical protein TVAG_123080 [Trichomonas vaginalis G3]KAI5549324.1 tRNA (uracil) methyltransferase protein [Trichomonas vaginalis G3]|eukprot:XP_001308647.1 hypothetical protein [Trichomonas vaginalis G3]